MITIVRTDKSNGVVHRREIDATHEELEQWLMGSDPYQTFKHLTEREIEYIVNSVIYYD